MPNVVTHTGAEYAEAQGEMAPSTGLYEAMRSKYDDYFQVTHDQLGLASDTETQQLRSWIDNIAPTDTAQIQDANKWYQQDYQKRARTAMELYHGEFLPPLQRALSTGVISQKSFDEWMNWARDGGRGYKEKEQSIERILPKYLAERQELHSKRQAIIRDPRLGKLSASSDPKMKALAAQISDESYFLSSLSFKERERCITEVLNALPFADGEQKLFAGFEESLGNAVSKGLISEESRKKWIARFKNPADQLKTKEYFVKHQFPSYVKGWQKEHDKRSKLQENPLFKDLTDKDVKELSKFKDNSKFRNLHFDARQNLNKLVENALKAKSVEEKQWLTTVTGAIGSAAEARYVSKNRVGELVQHMKERGRSLKEVKDFVKQWAKLRYRFDKIERRMLTEKVPQGLNHLSEEKFLMLTYNQRLSYVTEVEHRLNIETSDPKDTPFQDAKGKVRHALDLEQWDEAEYYLKKAWPLAETEEEIRELQSMETYLRSFDSKAGSEEKNDAWEEVNNAREEIALVLSLLPVGLREIYRKALIKGAGCLQCVTTCVYNRTWCQERGYLTEGLEDRLRKDSVEETAERLRPSGEGHGDGLENNNIDGFHAPSIRNKGIGPQNLFLSAGGADAFVEKANANKNTWSFWYWSNAIVDGVSAGQNAYVAYNLNYRIKRAARTLEKHGVSYSSTPGPVPSLN